MKYFDKTFFKFLVGFSLIIAGGLFFVSKVEAQSALVNINSASSQELQTLDGIGPTYAQRIIDYRTANGPFVHIEDIKNVSGIGDTTFNNIKDYITVGEMQSQPTTQQTTQNVATPISSTGGASAGPVIEGIDYKIIIDKEKKGTVGSPMTFRAKHNVGGKRVGVRWVFGDGSVAYGTSVTHTYDYPGEYVVVASANTIEDSVSARMNVKISGAGLGIAGVYDDRIEIVNNDGEEADLYGRKLVIDGREFIFPENTVIKGKQKVAFSNKVTGLQTNSSSKVSFVLVGEDVFSQPHALATNVDISKQDELIDQILTLQQQKMDLQKVETKVDDTQVSSVIVSEIANRDAEEVAKTGWIYKIKKFFGLR